MQTIIVDMTPGFRMPTIYYSQGDVGTQFAIDLRSRFGDSFPTGTTVTIQATKPSGFGFSVAATSVTNGVATFTTTAEMTDEFGRFPAELKVTKTGLTLFTANFYMDGERNTHPEGTTDGSQETVIPELTQLVERVEDAASSVLDMTVVANTLPAGSDATYSYDEETNTATFGIPKGADGSLASGVLAPTYSSSSTYAVGDYVYYSGSLYRCTTAITTAESFTAAHWTQVVLGDDVSDLKSEINDMSEVVSSVNLYDKASAERVQNSYLNWRGKETSYTGAVISPYISVSEGDVLRWVYNPNTSNNYGSFYDGTKTFSAQIGSSSPTTETHAIDGYNKKVATVTVPSGTSYARINLNMVDDNDYNMITVNNLVPSVFVPYYKKRIVPTAIQNPLYQKTAIFNGDSICAGTVGISASDTRYGWGWAGRIGTQNDMIWHNFGIAGGTVCTDTYNYTKVGTTGIDWSQDCYIRIGSSASGTDTMYALVTQQTWDGTSPIYYRGDARHWESTDIDNMKTAYPTADYVILEACLNDGFNGVPKGVVSASYSGTFVTTTFASAMEYMLNRALSLFPKAKVGVIFPPRPDGSNAYISQLNALAESACKKWGIPYLDLYSGSGLCVNNSTQASLMYHDSTHLSQVGYDFITRKIESWMQTL